MTISVRPIRKRDAKIVCRLFREFVAYFFDSVGYRSGTKFTETAFRRDCFGRNRILMGWVAVIDHEIVGYVLCHYGYNIESAKRLLFVADFFVMAQHRRKGIGTALMRAVATYAKTKNVQGMTWDVHTSDSHAVKFYKKLGAITRADFAVMLLENKPFERLAKK